MNNALKSHVMDTMHWISKAKECLSDELDQGESRACACANMAMTILLHAQHECIRLGIDPIDYDEFFHRADTCIREIIDDYASNHSQQWSFIQFNELKKTYDALEL